MIFSELNGNPKQLSNSNVSIEITPVSKTKASAVPIICLLTNTCQNLPPRVNILARYLLTLFQKRKKLERFCPRNPNPFHCMLLASNSMKVVYYMHKLTNTLITLILSITLAHYVIIKFLRTGH